MASAIFGEYPRGRRDDFPSTSSMVVVKGRLWRCGRRMTAPHSPMQNECPLIHDDTRGNGRPKYSTRYSYPHTRDL